MNSESNTVDQQETPMMFIDSRGLMASDPDAHVLLCADPDHLEALHKSILRIANSEPCPACGEKPSFRGRPQICPRCNGDDAECPMGHGDSKNENVYVVSIPKTLPESPESMTRDEFRQSIRQAWGDPISHLDTLVGVAQQTMHLLLEEADLGKDKVSTIVTLAARACQTADAIASLLREGHPDAAFALSRVLQETMINALSIHHDERDDLAERFRKWSFGSIFRIQRQLVQLGVPEVSDAEYRQMEDAYQLMLKEYGDDFKHNDGWIGNNLADRAKSIGLEEEYRKFYGAASAFVHVNAYSLMAPIGKSERSQDNVLLGPSGIGLDLPAIHTALSLVGLLMAMPKALEIRESTDTEEMLYQAMMAIEQMMEAIQSTNPQNLYRGNIFRRRHVQDIPEQNQNDHD